MIKSKIQFSKNLKKLTIFILALIMIVGSIGAFGTSGASANLLTTAVESITETSGYNVAADSLGRHKLYDGDLTHTGRYAAYKSGNDYSSPLVMEMTLDDTYKFDSFKIHMLSTGSIEEVCASSVTIEVGLEWAGTVLWTMVSDKKTLSDKNDNNYKTVKATSIDLNEAVQGNKIRVTFEPRENGSGGYYQYQIAEIEATGEKSSLDISDISSGKTVTTNIEGISGQGSENLVDGSTEASGFFTTPAAQNEPLSVDIDLEALYDVKLVLIMDKYRSDYRNQATIEIGQTVEGEVLWTKMAENESLTGTAGEGEVATSNFNTSGIPGDKIRITFESPDGTYPENYQYEVAELIVAGKALNAKNSFRETQTSILYDNSPVDGTDIPVGDEIELSVTLPEYSVDSGIGNGVPIVLVCSVFDKETNEMLLRELREVTIGVHSEVSIPMTVTKAWDDCYVQTCMCKKGGFAPLSMAEKTDFKGRPIE